MSESDSKPIKDFYFDYHDSVFNKRYNSPFWLRRYAHRMIYQRTLDFLKAGQRVLDSGCGEGVLSILMAQRGVQVTGIDMSPKNVMHARKLANDFGVKVDFLVGDAENLPFRDEYFDVVVSSHVIEHLPNPSQGLHELYRVSKNWTIVAMPTCLNPTAWALLGGDVYWKITKRSVYGVPYGLLKTIGAFLLGQEGPAEGYGGHQELPHVWRFPWVVLRMVRKVGFHVKRYEGDSLLIPYLAEYFKTAKVFQQFIDLRYGKPPFRYLGMGCHLICSKSE